MPELRRDPISGNWVVISPERLHRPLNFVLKNDLSEEPAQDPFCEGHEHYTPPEVHAVREGGSEPNAPGWKVRVVPNRFPALRVEGDLDKEAVGIYDRMNGIGAHEVVIESPAAGKELDELELADIVLVVKAWRSRMTDLLRDMRFRYLMVFKNVGAMAGASLKHTHSQIVALPVVPPVVKAKLNAAREYFLQKDRNLFEDILRNELKGGERLVFENAGFAVFCPFASRSAFETFVMPKRQNPDFHQCDDHELVLLADALKRVLALYSRGLDRPSYNLILNTAPVRRSRPGYWQTVDFDYRWHIEIVPRLSGLAGFEFGTGCHINPVMPEEAARFLRSIIKEGKR